MLYSKVLTWCQNDSKAQALWGQGMALWECSVQEHLGMIRVGAVGRTWRAAGSGYPRGSSPGSVTAGATLTRSTGVSFICTDISVVFFLNLSISNFTLVIFLCLFWGLEFNIFFMQFGSMEESNRCGLNSVNPCHHTPVLSLSVGKVWVSWPLEVLSNPNSPRVFPVYSFWTVVKY